MDDILSSSGWLPFLRELRNRDVRFMIVGTAAAALQGAGIVTIDIDLWFERLPDPRIPEAAEAAGGVYLEGVNLMPPTFGGAALDAFDIVTHMSGLGSFDEEYRHVRWIALDDARLPVLPVERILLSKRKANRPKDQAVLPILEDVVRTIETLEKGSQGSKAI